MKLDWDRIPDWRDPRLPVLACLSGYVILGITVLGFNRSPAQILTIVVAACVLDMALHFLLRERRLLFPLSAAITGLSLVILLNFAHGLWLAVVPVFFAIASKYAFTVNGRHVFNPSLFGIVMSLLVSEGMISASPAYQWGGSAAMAVFVVTAALVLFVFKIRRNALILSFLLFYFLELAYRAWLTRWHVPPETLFMGTLTSPAFYLFTFFMITDPATSPSSRRDQIVMALAIVLIDLWLHQYESLFTLFYAAFACFCLRFLWFHIRAWRRNDIPWHRRLIGGFRRWSVLTFLGLGGWLGYQQLIGVHNPVSVDLRLVEIPGVQAGISTRPGDILDRVDSRLAHVAKWLLAVGDAVAVADVDKDGLQDIFLTYPLKHRSDRAALYRNMGNFQFQRVPLPALDELVDQPEDHGLPSGALWFDYDNDGDPDLLLLVGFGHPRLLQNRWVDDGALTFVDVTGEMGIDEYTISVTANALDMNRDGRLDLIIGNVMNPLLPGYAKPTRFNIFKLPEPKYPGDRRMVNVMHRTWHDANNGGENLFYLHTGNRFEKQDIAKLGLDGQRWTLDIGTGDLNQDGWTDLYLANDFGPDQLYLNRQGLRFERIVGKLVGELGRDTYKGMNASLGDVDNNGYPDIYVSNVHEKLQAEGSLLWINRGTVDEKGAGGFADQAMARNALNEHRFGWGAAMGDLDRDGRLDIVQANGMVDDSYDKKYGNCPDYWYWNEKIALTGPDVHGYADRWADLRGRCIFPKELNRLYLNQGNYFVDVGQQVGWTKAGNSRGVALVDLDNDGDLDVLITHQFAPLSIYRNEGNANSWLGLQLEGNGKNCNRDALGSKIVVTYPQGRTSAVQIREITASNGLSAQGDRRILFGLAGFQGTVTVKIHWCGNQAAQLIRLQPDRYYRISQQS